MSLSRHVTAIFRKVARDFVCASATGFGIGVAVTRNELITAKAGLFGRVVLRRYRLHDIETIYVRRGRNVSFLVVEFMKSAPTHRLMVLYGSAAAPDFDTVAATVERLRRARTSTRPGQRRVSGPRAAHEDRPRLSAMP